MVIIELQAAKISDMKKTRSQKSVSEGYDLYTGLKFKANRDLESFLKQSLPLTNGTVREYSTEHQCGGCASHIVFGSSVLLMCECFNKPLCQLCARFNMAYWSPGHSTKTYESGVYCTICKVPTEVGNVNAAKAEETRLAKQACSELLNKPLKKTLGRRNIHKYTVQDFERYSIQAYLLEIARLEVRRQNRLNNIEDTTPELPLGPLRLLTIKTNPLLETYLFNTRRIMQSKKNRKAPLINEYDAWFSLDPHGTIIPLNRTYIE